MSDQTNLRERLAYTLYESAIAAGLETSTLDYSVQKPDYLNFADQLLSRLLPDIPSQEPKYDAQRPHVPQHPQSHARPPSG